jgi:hypothetical protein
LVQCTPKGGAKYDEEALVDAIGAEFPVVVAGVYVSELNAITNMKNSGVIFNALEFMNEIPHFLYLW